MQNETVILSLSLVIAALLGLAAIEWGSVIGLAAVIGALTLDWSRYQLANIGKDAWWLFFAAFAFYLVAFGAVVSVGF